MTEANHRILCIAREVHGQRFLEECAEMGLRPTLLTLEHLRGADWPRALLEELASMPGGLSLEQILNTISWMARGRNYSRVVALAEGDLTLAAQIREHLRVPGMGVTTAGYYRDRLAMRIAAREAGFPVAEFCRVLNYDELRSFMETVPAPWLLEPRYGLSGVCRQLDEPDQLWRSLEELGDDQSRHMVRQYLPGMSYQVDAVISERSVLFSLVRRLGQSAVQMQLRGGMQSSWVIARESREWMEVTALNAGLAPALGMARGVIQAEYQRTADGRLLFQEIATPVNDAWGLRVVAAASGVNLWRELARLEACHLRGEHYLPPESYEEYAGCLYGGGAEGQTARAGLSRKDVVGQLEDGLLFSAEAAESIAGILEGALSGE